MIEQHPDGQRRHQPGLDAARQHAARDRPAVRNWRRAWRGLAGRPSLPLPLLEREARVAQRQVATVEHLRHHVGAVSCTWKFTTAGLPSLSS